MHGAVPRPAKATATNGELSILCGNAGGSGDLKAAAAEWSRRGQATLKDRCAFQHHDRTVHHNHMSGLESVFNGIPRLWVVLDPIEVSWP